MRGLAGCPQAAAEAPEGYLNPLVGWIPLRSGGLNPKLGFPSLEHQSLKSTQMTSSCEKPQGCSLPETDGCRCKEPLKGPMHIFYL